MKWVSHDDSWAFLLTIQRVIHLEPPCPSNNKCCLPTVVHLGGEQNASVLAYLGGKYGLQKLWQKLLQKLGGNYGLQPSDENSVSL